MRAEKDPLSFDSTRVESSEMLEVAGSGIEFDDRGAHALQGVAGEWRLFAVKS